MPRGRPRKQPVVEEHKSRDYEIIAEVLAQWCGVPGCSLRHHFQEAENVIQALKEEGFEIRELNK